MGKRKKCCGVNVSITINLNGEQGRRPRKIRMLIIDFVNPPEGEGGEPSTAECDDPFEVRVTVAAEDSSPPGSMSVGAILTLPGNPPEITYVDGVFDAGSGEWVMTFTGVKWPSSGTCYVSVFASVGTEEPTVKTVSFLPCASDSTQTKT